jgi:hypothetical protein
MTSKIYKFNGDIQEISMSHLYDGKPFFRKMTNSLVELEICRRLQSNDKKHKHIVTIYHVGFDFVDMELLDETYDNKKFDKEETDKIIEIMREVKVELQSLGILYIDWKIDNIGFSETDNTHKLFDFDCSGIMNLETKEWLMNPKRYYAYNMAITAGKERPLEIDDYIFETEKFV